MFRRLFCAKEDDLSKLLRAEAVMIEYAKKFGDRDSGSYQIETRDTPIPAHVLPLKKNCLPQKEDLYMHSVKVTSKYDPSKEDVPIVILHGYMNGALYFYRNIVSLSNHFQTVYSVDILGMGLSSRKPGLLKKVHRSVEATEDFFVRALDAWREANGIKKMILAGHSIGGYIAVPYAEQFPSRISNLLLLTPVGLTRENPQEIREMLSSMSWTRRRTANLIRYLFDCGVTPASFLRKLPRSRAKSMVLSYVQRRLPVITDPKEQQAVANYLYYLAMLPGFGENMLNRFLRSSSHGIKPTVDRIPKLKVPKVSLIYGDSDWMDIEGGIEACEESRQNGSLVVEVYQLQDAGHLMMLDNWRGFYAGIVTMCGETVVPPNYPTPTLVRTTRSQSVVLSVDVSLERRLDKAARATKL